MTIREAIINMEISYRKERIAKLEELGAPSVILDAEQKTIEVLNSGKLEVGGKASLLDAEYEDVESKKGRGGKYYYSFNHGTINYFPRAKFGGCIYEGTPENNPVFNII